MLRWKWQRHSRSAGASALRVRIQFYLRCRICRLQSEIDTMGRIRCLRILGAFGQSGSCSDFVAKHYYRSKQALIHLEDALLIIVQARQQMIFRQFEGLFPMPVWFEVGITVCVCESRLAQLLTSLSAINGMDSTGALDHLLPFGKPSPCMAKLPILVLARRADHISQLLEVSTSDYP